MFHRKQIKKLLQEAGNARAAACVMEHRFNLPESDPRRWTPDDFSLMEIAEACGGDTSQAAYLQDKPIFSEAVGASQFQTLVGVLLSKKVMDAYQAEARVADKIYDKFNSSLETDRVPGGYIAGTLEDITEGGLYPHTADILEKYVTMGHGKKGLILDITEESVRFDRSGIVMREAVKLGQRMAVDRESRALNTFQDITNYKAWYPSGTQADLYQNAQGAGDAHEYDNLVTDVLADYTDINSLWTLLKLMKDDNGDPMVVDPKLLLVPVTLSVTAKRVIKNTVLAGASNAEMNPFANAFEIIDSQYLDAQSTTAWYLGDPKKQFLEKVVIPPQVTSRRSGDMEEGWNRDILAQWKVRYDSTFGATDYRFVGKSTGAG
jgi:hypothetical protein